MRYSEEHDSSVKTVQLRLRDILKKTTVQLRLRNEI